MNLRRNLGLGYFFDGGRRSFNFLALTLNRFHRTAATAAAAASAPTLGAGRAGILFPCFCLL
jgi:hypothetical protein